MSLMEPLAIRLSGQTTPAKSLVMPRYSEYKDSGVEWLGEVPGHWEVKPIKAVSTCNDAVLEESTSPDYEIEYIEISGVDAIRGISETTVIPFGNAPSRARRRVADGDVLVSTVRTYLRAIAPVTNPPTNMIASTGFAVIRPRHIEPSFLGFMFQAEFLIAEIIARSVGVSYPAINASDLMRLDMPIPTREEQQTIAAFLDRETGKIDALIAEQRRLVELLAEKRQAVISHAVTKGLNPNVPMKDSGIEWLGEVPEHWTMVKIMHLVAKFEQGWSPQCEGFPVESEQEWGVLKVGCVNGGTFKPEENKTLPSNLEPIPALGILTNDLLISRANTRELVGSAAIAMREYKNLLLCDKLYRLRFLNGVCSPMFIALYLGTNGARGQIELAATGASSSMVNIAQSTILDMNVALPTLKEQEAIVLYLDQQSVRFDTLTNEAQCAIDLLQERRSALISAAVTGKIDVRATRI
jgi:type I restriction enzyme S subunit